MEKPKRKRKKLLKAVVIWLPILLCVSCIASYGAVYETNDVSDYGKIVGNFDNKSAREFIFSFFPQELDSSFSDITYYYWAKKGDAYAYECFLEFTIEDKHTYEQFIEQYANSEKTQPFAYDSNYMEYSVSNVIAMHWDSPNDEGGYPITWAWIGKVLYCEEQQKICFFALSTYDGSGTDTTELNYFFDKFNVNLINYQMDAYLSRVDQENGRTCKMRYESGVPLLHPYPYPYYPYP